MTELKMLSHASASVSYGGKTILMDPWLLGSCYWRSWWNYPPVKPELKSNLKVDAIYITHVHWDHWHGPTLKKLFSKDTLIITHDEPNTRSVNDMEEMFSRMYEDLQSNPDLIIDRDYIGNITQQGSKAKSGFTTNRRQVQKSLLMINELFGELNPKSDINNDIKEHRSETLKFEKQVVDELNDNPEFKQSALDKCKEKLPLQDILEGKEVMAVGDTIISKKTLKRALGTDDWKTVKESLVVETDPSPRLVYKGKVDGQDRTFSFGDVVVREDGKGYSSSMKFEIKFNKDLKDFTSAASQDTIGRQRNVFDPTIGS